MQRALRRLTLLAAAGGLVVAGCGSAEDSAEDKSDAGDSANSAGSSPSADLTGQGGIVVAGSDISDDASDTGSPVEVVVYEDFQCPYCKQLEESVGDDLEDSMENGDITVEYRIVSFLDKASPNEYSSRAANAALCVFDAAGPGVFHDFHGELFEDQPDEGSAGPEDDELIAVASDEGADVEKCINDKAMGDQVTKSTDLMADEGVTGTPAVFVDGEQVEIDSESAVQDAIESAVG